MRKLLRSKATKAFLTGEGGWTTDLSQAFELIELIHTSDASNATRGVKTSDLEIYYSFDEHGPSQWDVALPLH